MGYESGQSKGLALEESSWQEKIELSRPETAANSSLRELKRQRAPHYIKVIEQEPRALDGFSQATRKEWRLCPDCKNDYHGH